MTPNMEALTAIRQEVAHAEGLLFHPKFHCWTAKQEIHKAMIALNFTDGLDCLPYVREALELADVGMQGHEGTGPAMGCIARAMRTLATIQNKAPQERGRFVA